MPVLDADPAHDWYTMPLATGSLRWLYEDGRFSGVEREIALDVVNPATRGLEYAWSGVAEGTNVPHG